MERHRRTEKEHLKLETLNKRKVRWNFTGEQIQEHLKLGTLDKGEARMERHRSTETGALEIRDLG